ncbi:uncharacterized protein LOC115796819 [Archocentrus centrarchus]|uniref:uncharacterized protein LOC115796819 n=1 Tax=Archocentrus centrarchus TaxID=63155 RepID=UPI0011E9D926|nr:uncharacterized protein LOC115796819 [Archocentrus centrarchus]
MNENSQMDPPTMLCDMCTEEDRKPAKKTCMKCEISMCVQHLQAHLTTPVLLQTHPLTEPMALCGKTKCSQHSKILEYYCLDDMTCVCVSCAIEDQHRLHDMKTFSTAHEELLEKLKAEQQILQEKTDDEDVSLEKWEKSERGKLGCCSVRLIEAVTNLRDISLSSIQSSVSARMVSLKTSKSSIEAALKEKDTFRFLQMYSQLHQDVEKAKAVDLRKGLEPGSDRDKLVEEIRQNGEKIMMQASQFWGSLLTLVDPENHQELVPTDSDLETFPSSSDLLFVPQSLSPGMSLSTDYRKVFHSRSMRLCSSHIFCIKSTLLVPDFKRWMISISKDCDWIIGLCDSSYINDMKNGYVYGLRCQGEQLISLTTEYSLVQDQSVRLMIAGNQTTENPRQYYKPVVSHQVLNTPRVKQVTGPQQVEVVWSFPDSLSFFSRIGQHQRIKLLTVKISSTSLDLKPFVCLEGLDKEESQKSSGLFAFSGQQQYQTSSFGMGFGTVGTGFSFGSRTSFQSASSRGGLIGSPPITVVLCELL